MTGQFGTLLPPASQKPRNNQERDCTDGLDVGNVLDKTVPPAPPAPLSGD